MERVSVVVVCEIGTLLVDVVVGAAMVACRINSKYIRALIIIEAP